MIGGERRPYAHLCDLLARSEEKLLRYDGGRNAIGPQRLHLDADYSGRSPPPCRPKRELRSRLEIIGYFQRIVTDPVLIRQTDRLYLTATIQELAVRFRSDARDESRRTLISRVAIHGVGGVDASFMLGKTARSA